MQSALAMQARGDTGVRQAPHDAIAVEVMKARGIAINDLYAFAKPRLAQLQQPRNVHFHRKGSDALAYEVVKHIRAALSSAK